MNVTVATVSLVLVTTAVKPVGTLVTTAPVSAFPFMPVKVSLAKVNVTLAVIEPSFAAASAKVVPL